MATVLPAQDRFAGLRGFAENFVQGIIQNQQNQALSQQLGQVLGDPSLTQGITDPTALGVAGQLGVQRQGQQNALALQQQKPPTETQIRAKVVGDALRKPDNIRTEFEKQAIDAAFGINPAEKKNGIVQVLDVNGKPKALLIDPVDGTIRKDLGRPNFTPSQQLSQFAVDEINAIDAKPNKTPADIARRRELVGRSGQQITTNVNLPGETTRTVEQQLKGVAGASVAINQFKTENPDIVKDNEITMATNSKGEPQLLIKPRAAAGDAALKEFSDLVTLRDSAKTAQTLFDPSFVGLVQGSDIINAIERKTGITGSKEVSFKRIVNDLSDRLLRARSGAQINEQEFERLTKIVPRLDTAEVVFEAEMKSFIDELDKILNTKQKISEQAGRRGLRQPGQQVVPSPTTQAEFDAIPKGAEFIDTDGIRKRKQ